MTASRRNRSRRPGIPRARLRQPPRVWHRGPLRDSPPPPSAGNITYGFRSRKSSSPPKIAAHASPVLNLTTNALPAACTKTLTVWALLAGLLLIIALAGPFFAGRVYTRDDLGAYHLPVRAFFAAAVGPRRTLRLDAATLRRLLPDRRRTRRHVSSLAPAAVSLLAAPGRLGAGNGSAPIPFCCWACWLFLRRLLGRGDAAMLGSLMFTFCSFNLLHFVHPNAVAVIAHIPWLLWASISCSPIRGGARWPAAASRHRAADRFAVAAGLSAIRLVLVAGRSGLCGLRALQPPLQPPLRLRACDLVRRLRRLRRAAPGRGWSWPRASGVLLGGVQLWPTLDALQPEHAAGGRCGVCPSRLRPPGEPDPTGCPLPVHRPRGGRQHPRDERLRGAVPLMLIVWLVVQRRHLGPLAAVGAGDRLVRRLRPDVGDGRIRLPLPVASVHAAGQSFPLPVPLPGVVSVGHGDAGGDRLHSSCSAPITTAVTARPDKSNPLYPGVRAACTSPGRSSRGSGRWSWSAARRP